MEKKIFSNDFGSGVDIRNDKIFDEMIDSYLNRWDPYDYGR